jgi:Flp pilus assembly protein TadG
MSRLHRPSIGRDTWAGAALEMAFVTPVLIPMLLGPLELGLYWWTKTTLQSVANETARCVAIGNPACTTTTTSPNYAANLAQSWSSYPVISAADVTVTAVSACNGVTGSFKQVVIRNHQWSNVFHYPISAAISNITACYPT